ncbi:hypothetical protein BEWA_021550 [Theileria equi strain WA]|uniref:Alpha-carbonic anhydrase domain-containing protein n=1 Tax=Theileria equi strain WA TaxID=1537102 RepID=L0AUK2_THEEQ|nr:hypothetical protein BEWA_021550 [Theileria equi strain WA]AFZ79307.1 hypothetical protein BEWA_021550 [Theileria equi strain WA]|eukprot:XP_004828973.1 hypothetical protein BEWA_021550 [Theileria equi strain WA]
MSYSILVLLCIYTNLASAVLTTKSESLGSNISAAKTDSNDHFVIVGSNDIAHEQSSTQRTEDIKSHEGKPFENVTPENNNVKWNYIKHGANWTNGTCQLGMRQSPVDLHVEGLDNDQSNNLKRVYDAILKGGLAEETFEPWKRGDIVYTYNHYMSSLQILRSPNQFRITIPSNEGSTFGALFTTDKPNLYMATHIDFHSPSEHTFEGSANRRQIEMQIWHYLSDSKTNDLGVSSVDRPETTEVNLLLNKIDDKKDKGTCKKGVNAKENTKDVESVQKKDEPKTDKNKTASEPTKHDAEIGLHSEKEPEKGTKLANGEDQSKLQKLHERELAERLKHENNHHTLEDFFNDLDNGEPSMIQLRNNIENEYTHPLTTEKSSAYKRLFENEHFDLFNKYMMTHLKNSSNNSTGERMHIKEKNMARDKNMHWGRWAVISLTFMSEEIEKTSIESLKTFPSERFIDQIFSAGSSVEVTENSVHSSVGDLNTSDSKPVPTVNLTTPVNLSSLFMMLETKNVNYFAYDGSFTQPGCEETVRWYVAKESLPISTELMLHFHRMLNPNLHIENLNDFVDNYRELQNVNNKSKNTGKVRFVHGYPMEYFVLSPFKHGFKPPVSSFKCLQSLLPFAILMVIF